MDPPLTHPPPTVLQPTVAAPFTAIDPVVPSLADVPPSHAPNATASTVSHSFATHPPYAEMIYAAITALKERDGSSKRAIEKYIEKAYASLPPTHSTLLAHHLKLLKNSGQLVMVKKSYKLPGSDSTTAVAAQTPLPQPSQGQKRGRGRPSKPKPESNAQQPASPQPQSFSVALPQQQQQSSLFPQMVQNSATTQIVAPTTSVNANTQPVLVALGLADEPKVAKRGPGRPKKSSFVTESGQVVMVKRGRGRPPKKTPGRPRKPKSVMGALAPRGRGRPPKTQTHPVAVTYAPDGTLIGVSRPRGRPRKGVLPAPGLTTVLIPGKRAGRPPKFGGIAKPRKSTGRPVGRPKKNSNVSWTITELSQTQAEEAIADLKRKLDFFQSRVRQAVGLLKPQLSSETGISVMTAIQELEGLAAMDFSAPLREDPLPPVVQS
ncbi:hypothetical protein K2173_028265 [Erythroxylum novogranatense]|uniref:H15 domain-containing protein n=1 Tax=Erythroxylum novogranatense TaxID=1862640 RepID=A0AAV8U5B1_9ROSI|nr:hypothetical protein K2173_028265 [Erythroxylum novogranatense]